MGHGRKLQIKICYDARRVTAAELTTVLIYYTIRLYSSAVACTTVKRTVPYSATGT